MRSLVRKAGMESLSEMLSKKFGLTMKRSNKIIKILRSIEIGILNIDSLSKTLGVSSRNIEKDIELLKKQGFIQFKGSRKTGKYKSTEKYRKLKDNLQNRALKVRSKIQNKVQNKIMYKHLSTNIFYMI